jgi:Tfp pilus assembly protein PilF
MMNRYTRRKFLKTLAIGTGAMFLPPFVLNGRTAISTDTIDKEKLRKEASECFYKRRYGQAEELYKQLTEQYPDYIPAWDGLAKVYNAQQNGVAAVELYRSALDKNPQHPLLYDRLARAVNALSLGNYRQEKIYMENSGEDFPIQASALLYIQAITMFPDKKYLYEGLLDTVQCLEKKNRQLKKFSLPELDFSAEVNSQIATLTSGYKNDWEKTRTKEKNRGKYTNQLPQSLDRLAAKKRRTLYLESEQKCREASLSKKKKEYLYPYFVAAIKAGQYEQAEDCYRQIKETDTSETYTRHILSKGYKKQGQYDKLIELWEKEDTNISSCWQKMHIANALVLKAEKTNSPLPLQRATQIYMEIRPEVDNTARDTRLTASLYSGLARCSFLTSGMNAGRMQLQQGLEKLPPGSGEALSLLIRYAESYGNGDSASKAEKILSRLSGENKASTSIGDPFMERYIKNREEKMQWERTNGVGKWAKTTNGRTHGKGHAQQGKNNRANPEQDDLKASYALVKLYEKKSNPSRRNAVLNYIEGKDPGNTFAGKRKRNNGSR